MDILSALLTQLNNYQYLHKDFDTFYNNINLLIRRSKSREIKNILISQASGIGDAIISTPFIRETHRLYPQANIYLVIPNQHVPIYAENNYIKVFSFNPDTTNMFTILKDIIDFSVDKLLHKNIDIAFSPMFDPKITMLFLNWLSGAPIRVGYGKHAKSMYFKDQNYYLQTFGQEFNFDKYLLTDLIYNPPSMFHEIDRRLYILEKFCDTKIYNKKLELFTQEKDISHLLTNKKKIVFGVGGSSKNKKWPMDKWQIVLNEFKDNYTCYVVGDINDQIDINDDKIINLIGKLSIEETIALIKASDIYVGHDTCLVHVASAYNKPCVVLYKEAMDKDKIIPGFLSFYHRYKPLTKSICIRPDKTAKECKNIYVEGHCSSEDSHCIKSISPTKVIKAIHKLLK